ncbi:hypothetical protein [Streptomyces sp. PU_AKi4]|uniref:hypothetical protein n=1 Tax=Streptomyces sp. PU_AKi4 TaxID=2800809 RepID=UPI003523C269
MWPGEQPPGGGQKPQQPWAGQQVNPYQQPQPWNAPTQPAGMPQAPPTGGGRNRTKLIAVMAAAAVVVAAAVTGYTLLGGSKDNEADPGPTKSDSSQESSGDPQRTDTETATVEGWKTVVNPSAGIAFDVPPQWAPESTDWVTYASENDDPEDKPLIAMRAPAFLQEEWCSSDEDRNGELEHAPLAAAGSRRNSDARSTEEIAAADPKAWVYGRYAQPDETKVKSATAEPFTTASGIEGTLGTAWSEGVEKSKKCTTNGKALTFAFKNTEGDLVSWSFFGAKDVTDEVPNATVREIAATVRLHEDPSGS